MGVAEVALFWERMKKNRQLCGQYLQAAVRADDQLTSIVEFAGSLGYEFSARDYSTALKLKNLEFEPLDDSQSDSQFETPGSMSQTFPTGKSSSTTPIFHQSKIDWKP